jgi:hypothetical protein
MQQQGTHSFKVAKPWCNANNLPRCAASLGLNTLAPRHVQQHNITLIQRAHAGCVLLSLSATHKRLHTHLEQQVVGEHVAHWDSQ